MRLSLILSAAISALSISSAVAAEPAAAGAPVTVAAREMIRTTDGKSVGRVDSINKAKDGSVAAVGVIYDGRIVHIPVSTLSAGQNGYVTSLTKADLEKLK